MKAIKWIIIAIVVIIIIYVGYKSIGKAQAAALNEVAQANGSGLTAENQQAVAMIASNEIFDVNCYENWQKKIQYQYIGTTEALWQAQKAAQLFDHGPSPQGQRIVTLPVGYPFSTSVRAKGEEIANVIMALAYMSIRPGTDFADNLNTTDMIRLVKGQANDLIVKGLNSRVTNQSQYAWAYAFYLVSKYSQSPIDWKKIFGGVPPNTNQFIATTSWNGSISEMANFPGLMLRNATGQEPKGGAQMVIALINQLPKTT